MWFHFPGCIIASFQKRGKHHDKRSDKRKYPKLLIWFLIPIIFDKLFQQIYSVVDAAIVGRTLGVTALGGVGSTGSINFLILGFCDGVILQSSVNALGPVYVSAQAAGHRINMLLIAPFNAYLNVSSTFTGQNMGAGEFDRIRKGVLWGHVILTGFWLLESVGATLLSDRMLLLFLTKEDVALVREPAMLSIYCFTYGMFFLSTVQVVRLAIQGMSFSRLALVAGMLEMIARAGCGLFLVPRFGYPAACLAAAIGWLLADRFLIPAFLVCFRKRRAQYAAGQIVF